MIILKHNFYIIINKIDENPNFIINIKNLEDLDISSSLVRKNGGLKKY